jgi:threonine dehydratase
MSSMPPTELTLRDVYAARQRIASVAARTPLAPSPTLSGLAGARVRLKLECVQHTGSFKVRGAANKLSSLSDEERARGVITFSTGNHGRAVAFVARQAGVKAVICLSEMVPANKVEGVRQFGAEVVRHGQSQDEAMARAYELVEERGLTLVHPFDDPQVIAGQGTIGLEILEELPGVDTVLVPLSGGGLIGGVALALKAANPGTRVVGVSMARGAAMYHSLQAGKPVQVAEKETLADSLSGGVGLDNRYTFEMVRRFVDEVVLLAEEEIAEGMAFTLEEHRLIVEGAGAVGIAALLRGKVTDLGREVAVVVSGGNVDIAQVLGLVQEYRPTP